MGCQCSSYESSPVVTPKHNTKAGIFNKDSNVRGSSSLRNDVGELKVCIVVSHLELQNDASELGRTLRDHGVQTFIDCDERFKSNDSLSIIRSCSLIILLEANSPGDCRTSYISNADGVGAVMNAAKKYNREVLVVQMFEQDTSMPEGFCWEEGTPVPPTLLSAVASKLGSALVTRSSQDQCKTRGREQLATPTAVEVLTEDVPLVELLPQPKSPLGRIVILEADGGYDKAANGHRFDTIPICNALIERGYMSYPVTYTDDDFDKLYEELSTVDAYIPRICLDGKYPGVKLRRLELLMAELSAHGVLGMSHPDVVRRFSSKDAIQKARELSCGLPDTYSYFDIDNFHHNFPWSIANGTRVLQSNYSTMRGQGVWVVQVREGWDGPITGSTPLTCHEACSSKMMDFTLEEFMTMCERFLVNDDDVLIDQRYLPRMRDGYLRMFMIGDTPIEVIQMLPSSARTSQWLRDDEDTAQPYPHDDPRFKALTQPFLTKDLPRLMNTLGMKNEPLPLIWTCDFVPDTSAVDDSVDTYHVYGFDCSCVGLEHHLHLAGLVAEAAISVVSNRLKPQPETPQGRIVVLEVRGGDKCFTGFLPDTLPLCNALIRRNWSAVPLFYSDIAAQKVAQELTDIEGFIVRIPPGTYDGVTPSRLEKVLVEAAVKGPVAMSHPDVMRKLGCKEGLVKASDLLCCATDTASYETFACFQEQFPASLALGARVLKPNSCSNGDHVWVVRLKQPLPPTTSLASPLPGDTLVVCQSAKDNHTEEMPLDAFLTRWHKCFKTPGGVSPIINQRFLPRIQTDGEVRIKFVMDEPVEISHRMPVPGGFSACPKAGAVVTNYSPVDSRYSQLVNTFVKRDLPLLTPALRIDDQPLPLMWTADFVLGKRDPAKMEAEDVYLVVEFNCACVSPGRQWMEKVADAAVELLSASPSSHHYYI